MKYKFPNVQLEDGSVWPGDKTAELVEGILKILSDNHLSYEKAKIVLDSTGNVIGCCAQITGF